MSEIIIFSFNPQSAIESFFFKQSADLQTQPPEFFLGSDLHKPGMRQIDIYDRE